MASHRADFVSQLSLNDLLDGFETWALMCLRLQPSEVLQLDAEDWRRTYRTEIIRRCAEENFQDGRVR